MGTPKAWYNEIDPYAAQWLRNLIAAGHIAPGDVDERSILDVHPDDLRGYTQCHFFAGIGGWSLGARLAGWPDERPLWTGSCPCQPFSVAGKGAGHKDERHLWPAFRNLIAECKPQVIGGEQVSSAEIIGSSDEVAFAIAVREGRFTDANRLAKKLARSKSFHFHSRWIDGVLFDLETLDYAGWADVIPACAVDAPHRRDRLWFVADANLQRRDGKHTRVWEEAAGRDTRRLLETAGRGTGDERFTSSPWYGAAFAVGADGKARRVEPGIRLLAHGVPARVGKLRAYGNAIVPQVAAEVIAAYLDAEHLRLTEAA